MALRVPVPGNRAGGWAGLQAAQRCGLAAAIPQSGLRKVIGKLPASGILQRAAELGADPIALLDQGHGWVHKLISGSAVGDVLWHAQVPVLLPAHRPPAQD